MNKRQTRRRYPLTALFHKIVAVIFVSLIKHKTAAQDKVNARQVSIKKHEVLHVPNN